MFRFDPDPDSQLVFLLDPDPFPPGSGSADRDPDPDSKEIVTDPQHCLLPTIFNHSWIIFNAFVNSFPVLNIVNAFVFFLQTFLNLMIIVVSQKGVSE